ncbi:MAG: hypothetical protein IKU60_01035 [Clostridia bacterium]|nr:hypothetical protein [Clostridia bacterium]
MKKKSMIFRLFCLTLAMALCLSVTSVFAEEAVGTEEVAEEVAEEVTEAEETVEDVTEEAVEDVTEPEETVTDVIEDEEVEEIVDLFTATMRDGGVYVTPGEDNAAVFTYDGLRYKVEAGQGNAIKLDGFESNPNIDSEPVENAKNRLQANGEVTTDAAHSGYFGLSVYPGDVVYRTGVTGNQVYVFSAWVKMPAGNTINDDDRAFTVVSESGERYIVGWNEIGRDIDATETWQQILFTFRAPENGLFVIDFNYKSRIPMALDDIELYEAEIFDNPLDIENIVCTDADGNEYDRASGFTTSGTLTHTTTLYNSDEDDVYFTAVMVLYKNDIMIDFEAVSDCALVLDDTDVTLEIEIPEDEDLTQYKYMVYFINDTTPTQYYGKMPWLDNPYIVEGK